MRNDARQRKTTTVRTTAVTRRLLERPNPGHVKRRRPPAGRKPFAATRPVTSATVARIGRPVPDIGRVSSQQPTMLTGLTQTPPFGGSPPVAIGIYSQWLDRLGRRAQILREEGKRPAPGEIGRRLVVARGAGVVVEGVLGAGIDVDRVFLVVGF